MNANCILGRGAGRELKQVVEPLANYICASERPQAVLNTALSALFREITATNHAAATHFRTFMENHRS
jgi:hypothetical protein